MIFEKALEAMKQGKKVRRKSDLDEMCFFIRDGKIISMYYGIKRLNPYSTIGGLSTECMLANDWEIYEEPQKEPEMTAEKAVEILRTIRMMKLPAYLHGVSISGCRNAIDFAIKSLESKVKVQQEKKCESDSEKWIERAVDNQRIKEEFKGSLAYIREQPNKIKPEKSTADGISRLISEKSELQVKYDRLLKDYELARHECKQKTEHIGKLEEKQEELLKEISALRKVIADCEEKIQTYAKRTALFTETIDGIRNLIDGE